MQVDKILFSPSVLEDAVRSDRLGGVLVGWLDGWMAECCSSGTGYSQSINWQWHGMAWQLMYSIGETCFLLICMHGRDGIRESGFGAAPCFGGGCAAGLSNTTRVCPISLHGLLATAARFTAHHQIGEMHLLCRLRDLCS